MKRLKLVTALLLTTVGSSSWAQSAADHEKHHPQQQDAGPASAQPSPPAGQGMMGGGGMMGGSQEMMGRGGMMNMMGSRMPMMDMMQMMVMMRQLGDGTSGMATIDHVEGRIAFLHTELKITDAQASAWNAFADALRANAKGLGEVRGSMMSQMGTAQQSLVDRLALQEKWLAARLEGTRAIKSALANLVGTFSEEQTKTADEILAPHMGMMPMMSAMQGSRTESGQMQPGMQMRGR